MGDAAISVKDQDNAYERPLLNLKLQVKTEPGDFQPSPVLIKTPPPWAKKFTSTILAPISNEKWKAVQPTMKGVDEFIPLQMNEEEKVTAAVELTVMKMLTEIRDRVEKEQLINTVNSTSDVDMGTECEDEHEDHLSSGNETEQEASGAIQEVQENNNQEYITLEDEEAGIEEFKSTSLQVKIKLEKNSTSTKTSDGPKKKESVSQCDLRKKLIDLRNENSTDQKRRRSSSLESSEHISHLPTKPKVQKLRKDQVNILPIADDLNKMRKDRIGTDCEIKVQDETFYCHSIILKRCEGSFFRDILNEEVGYILQIEDISKETFEIILQYLYTSKVDLMSLDEAEQVLAASVMLDLKELIEHCTRFCTQQLGETESSFWKKLDELLKDQPRPYQICLFGVGSFNNLLTKKEFLSISYNTLHFVVEQSYLSRCTEKTLILYVEEWATYHLRNANIEVNFENLRSIIGPVFYKLRFLSLGKEDLLELFKQSQIISEKEKLAILESYVSQIDEPPNENICPIKAVRDCTRASILHIPKYSHSTKYIYVNSSSTKCSFVFAPNVDMLLLGFQCYSRISKQNARKKKVYNEMMTAQVLRLDGSNIEILREVTTSDTFEYDSYLSVKLPTPVTLKKSKTHNYAIKIILQGSGTYKLVENNYHELKPFIDHYIEPLRSEWCWGNDGIFTSLRYKVLK
ncbi:uncharacterized protein LOC132205136 [Neocloeon triangulifer]|uniref:uncharacterized protein LOC132205136 n=1 Tax=Neocloeon triangulifer TaxID=2078957 RepID=UPI00286F94C4|nr:uncharacterized protein LOC132205136 [Neocloeon triangulifer]